VEEQRAAPDSMLHFFRSLAQLRQDHPVLRRGDMTLLADTGPVLAFWRGFENRRYLVALNMSAESQTLHLPSATRVIYSSRREFRSTEAHVLRLTAYEIYVGEIGI
jgi:glycosidase